MGRNVTGPIHSKASFSRSVNRWNDHPLVPMNRIFGPNPEPLFSSRSRNPISLVWLLSPSLLSRDLHRRPSFSGLRRWPSSFDLQRRLPRLILLRSTVSLSSEPRAAGERVRVDLAAGQQRRHTSESAAPLCSTEKPAVVARGDAKAKPLIQPVATLGCYFSSLVAADYLVVEFDSGISHPCLLRGWMDSIR